MNRNEEITQTIKAYVEEKLITADGELPPKVQRIAGCIHKNLLNEQLTVSRIY